MDIASELSSLWYVVVAIWALVLALIPLAGRGGWRVTRRETLEGIRPLLGKLFLQWSSSAPITLSDIASHLNLVAPKAPIVRTFGRGLWFTHEIYWDDSNTRVLLDRLEVDLASVNREIQNRLRTE